MAWTFDRNTRRTDRSGLSGAFLLREPVLRSRRERAAIAFAAATAIGGRSSFDGRGLTVSTRPVVRDMVATLCVEFMGTP